MRHEVIGAAMLYHGDCLELLPHVGHIDAVVTDPPYNVGYTYACHDDSMENAEYLAWLKARFSAAAEAGAVQLAWFWQGIRVARGEVLPCLPEGFEVHHLGAWFKQEFAGDMFKGNHPAYTWEPIVWAALPGQAKYGGPKGGHAGRDCLIGNHSRHDGQFPHPCYKTLSVVRSAVNWIGGGEIVCDPFMGSGTTGVACMEIGRRFIGIEKNQGYFDAACRRIENAQRQSPMFKAGAAW